MRLIDVDSLELKLFNDDELPEYAILSHTWGDGEVSFQDMQEIGKQKRISSILANKSSFTSETTLAFDAHLMFPAFQLLFDGEYSTAVQEALENSQKSFTSRPGYQKIFKCAQTAKRLGLRYIWVDTCCIDKTSSAELQEAINSMYRYYKNSSICLVYLCDAKPVEHRVFGTSTPRGHFKFMLASSRWITRGWTLQELIAPRAIEFYAHDWSHLCNKTEWMDELSEVTGIPANILKTCDPSQACIAERMSWASKRSTTRIEDRAYCLLGLFDLQMPMLYGEGEKAFFRLQEGILKTSDDYSIFAWGSDEFSQASTYRGLLARSPSEFRMCAGYDCDRLSISSPFPITSTNLGLHVNFEAWDHNADEAFIGGLRTLNSKGECLGVFLRRLDEGSNQWARIGVTIISSHRAFRPADLELRSIYVRQRLQIHPESFHPEMYSFFIRKGTLRFLNIYQVWPPRLWDLGRLELLIPTGRNRVYGVFSFRLSFTSTQMLGCTDDRTLLPGVYLLVCFDHKECDYSCQFVDSTNFPWPNLMDDEATWREFLRRIFDFRNNTATRSSSKEFQFPGAALSMEANIQAALSGDKIALEIKIRDEMSFIS